MMEAMLILATIARRYRLVIEPGQALELLPSITLRPRLALRMRLKAHDHPVAQARENSCEPAGRATAI
jgi:hypothetical protein